MTEERVAGDVRLASNQQELLDRLRPLVARLDPSKVTGNSGLTTERSGKAWVVRLVVDALDDRIPGLDLFAAQEQCILAFAASEQLECHADPSSDSRIVDEVVGLTERYLSGITLTRHLDKRGRVVRLDCSYGVQSAGVARQRLGTSGSWHVFRTVDHSETLTYRFLRDEGAA